MRYVCVSLLSSPFPSSCLSFLLPAPSFPFFFASIQRPYWGKNVRSPFNISRQYNQIDFFATSQVKLLNSIKLLSISVLPIVKYKGLCLASEFSTTISGSFPAYVLQLYFLLGKIGSAFLLVQYFLLETRKYM